MAAASYVTTKEISENVAKLTSEVEAILQYVEWKKEQLERHCIESRRLVNNFRHLSSEGEYEEKVEIKEVEEKEDEEVTNQTNDATEATEKAPESEEQLAEIELIDLVLKKADMAWRKHKSKSCHVDAVDSICEDLRQILDSNGDVISDTAKVSSNPDAIPNSAEVDSNVGVISESVLKRILKNVSAPQTKSEPPRIPQKNTYPRNPQMVTRNKETTAKEVSKTSKILKKKIGNKFEKDDPNVKKSLEKPPKNCHKYQTNSTSNSKEPVKIYPKHQINGEPRKENKFTVDPDICKLWKHNYCLRETIRKPSAVSRSFCTQLESQMESSPPCGKLQVKLLVQQYQHLTALLHSIRHIRVSAASDFKDILRVKVYIRHIIIKTLQLNTHTEILLKQAQFPHQSQIDTSTFPNTQRTSSPASPSCEAEAETPFNFWIPPHFYHKYDQRNVLSLKLRYSRVSQLHRYWELCHQLQQKILSCYMLELFAKTFLSLMISTDIPKRDRVAVLRVFQGILWYNGEQFPVLLETRDSATS
ncbi:uncharacterized protein LOC115220739 [Argonauta hians]